eukprot:5958129-Pyramimonas_sp.AAC.1
MFRVCFYNHVSCLLLQHNAGPPKARLNMYKGQYAEIESRYSFQRCVYVRSERLRIRLYCIWREARQTFYRRTPEQAITSLMCGLKASFEIVFSTPLALTPGRIHVRQYLGGELNSPVVERLNEG